MGEHRADQFLKRMRRELVVELQFDFAGSLGERTKTPGAIEAAEWAIAEFDHDALGRLVEIGRCEVGSHAMVVDVDAHQHAIAGALEFMGAGAPRQEHRVIFDMLHKVEHLSCAIGNEYRLVDACHCYNKPMAPGLVER